MCEPVSEPDGMNNFLSILDIAFKVAAIFIAGFNAYFAVKIFRLKSEKDENEKERDRKIQLLKTLVLDHSLIHFHSFFETLEESLHELQKPNLTDDQKEIIDEKNATYFIGLRSKFYDSLLAVDETLYEEIKNDADNLQSHLTDTIFDGGVNLSHLPKYDELISQKLTTAKTNILKKLFNYRGSKGATNNVYKK